MSTTPQLTPARPAVRLLRALGAAVGVTVLAGTAATGAGTSASPGTLEGSQVAQVATTALRMTPEFRVATFNILGASHTDSARERARRRMESYEPRMQRAVDLLERRNFSIVGLQEYQSPQHTLFQQLTNGRWGVWPGTEMGRRPVQNSITWRADQWELVEGHLYEIPYFYGRMVQQPYIKLRNRDSGRAVWVINTHNVADSRGPAQHLRDRAVQIEIDLANELRGTGVPVLLTGDFNDTDEAFCPITANTDLKSVSGGGWVNGRCEPARPRKIDWVFVSRIAEVNDHTILDTANVDTITDHPIIYADVAIPAA